MEWWETLDHLELKLSLFSLSRMLIVFYLWVFEGFLKFNFRWAEVYGSREYLIWENYIKFLSYPSRWFCFFNGLLAFMQCAVFICRITFDICIIHVGTGASFIKDFSDQKNIRKKWGISQDFCISFTNHPWYASKIELSTEWYFNSKDRVPSHLSCLLHQHKRPYMQAIHFCPSQVPRPWYKTKSISRGSFYAQITSKPKKWQKYFHGISFPWPEVQRVYIFLCTWLPDQPVLTSLV